MWRALIWARHDRLRCDGAKALCHSTMPLPDSGRLSPDPVSPSVSATDRLVRWLRHFWPAPVGIDGRERLRVIAGAALGVLLTALLSRWWAVDHAAGPWMVASLGASAILVFGMPSSPLAQPWPVVGGSTLSALVGGACVALVPDPAIAGALAVGLALALMVPLRCLHPPGGAMALYVVMAQGNALHLAAFPICFNAVVLVVVGMAYNALTGRHYPHPQRGRGESAQGPAPGHFSASDVDAALSHYNQLLDVSREDLEGLLQLAGRAAFQRTLGELRCADVMSKPPFAIEAGVSLKDAWALMRGQQVKALPVVDAHRQVVGIVTVADFMRLANLDLHEGLGQRLRTLVMGRGAQPSLVREIMSHPVQVVEEGLHAMDLVPLFSHGGHHHIPIVDPQQRLVGIITQTDLVRTLATALQIPEDTAPARGKQEGATA